MHSTPHKKSLAMYIVYFNENTKHKSRRIYRYTSFRVCLLFAKWPFMTSFCVGTVKNILTKIAHRTIKFHAKFNLAEGVLSYTR